MPSKSRSRKAQNESESVSALAAKSAAPTVTNASIVPEKHIGAADVEMPGVRQGEAMAEDDLLRKFREEQQHARKRAHMSAAQQVLESMKPVNQRAAQLKRVLESRQAAMQAKVREHV